VRRTIAMPAIEHWAFPPSLQPADDEVGFELTPVLDAVVALRAEIPVDAFTASILGTERTGNGIVVNADGLVLTIGYLITEAESVWLRTNRGGAVEGYPLAYDFATGFGLVLPLGKLDAPPLRRGSIAGVESGDEAYVIGHGGRAHALTARVLAKREFAGYWEYVLDEALFTVPAHPEWSGAALVDDAGRLVGVGSLLVQESVGDETVQGNMFVPVDLLEPILSDLVERGRRRGAARPWLGMYTAQADDRLVVHGIAQRGPAQRAGVRPGDRVIEVAGERVDRLPDLFRRIWALGPAGTPVPLAIERDGRRMDISIRSGDREDFLRKPPMQ
jgi:S1-C subfamily serine protease